MTLLLFIIVKIVKKNLKKQTVVMKESLFVKTRYTVKYFFELKLGSREACDRSRKMLS